MAYLSYADKAAADARDAELWQQARRDGWTEGNVTTHLYPRRERVDWDGEDYDPNAGLPDGVDAAIVVPERDERLDGLILESALTDDELVALVEVYPAWQTGGTFAVDDLRSHDGDLYRCNLPHTNYDPSHTPDTTANLWTRVTPAGVIPAWVQPTGAQDAYHIGDLVTYNDWVWECTAADASGNNVWQPGVYGWTQVERV